MNWNWWKKYVLNIDTIIAIIVTCLVLYFIFSSKRKKYRFNFPNTNLSSNLTKKEIKKKKKKVNKHEEECRRVFQEFFGVKFKSVRPKWLKNPATNKNLELDGYNSHIRTRKGVGLAFEYDGKQHSKYTPHFHKDGVDEFEYQVVKDSWKDKKCKEKGVLLIRIPHFVAFQDLERYIKMILQREGISPSKPQGLYSKTKPKDIYKSFLKGTGMYG